MAKYEMKFFLLSLIIFIFINPIIFAGDVPGIQNHSSYGGDTDGSTKVLVIGAGGPKILFVRWDFIGVKYWTMGIRAGFLNHFNSWGIEAAVPMRLGLINKGIFSMSLFFDPGIAIYFLKRENWNPKRNSWQTDLWSNSDDPSMSVFSFLINPGVLMGMKPVDFLTITTGATVPMGFYFGSFGGAFAMGLHFHLGVEFAIIDNLNLFVRGEGGPHFIGYYRVWGEASIGVEWKLGK